MSEKFFYTDGVVDSNGVQTPVLNKAVFENGGLKVYTELEDSSDAGRLFVNQPNSPWDRDSAAGPADENGIIPLTIVEYNRPWDSAGEALNWAVGV